MAVCTNCVRLIFFTSLVLVEVACYEKTLRKIVRSQSKMVQRPFSDTGVGGGTVWRNASLELNDNLMFSLHSQKKKLHKLQRPKISTILSSVDTAKCSKSPFSQGKNKNMLPNELRQTRNTINNLTKARPPPMPNTLFPIRSDQRQYSNNSYSEEIAIDSYYEIPPQTNKKSILSNDIQMNSVETTNKQDVIIFPNEKSSNNKQNSSSLMRGIFISNSEINAKSANVQGMDMSGDTDTDRVDFLIQGKPIDAVPAVYSYNVSQKLFTCKTLRKSEANIVAQEKFSNLDIEANWLSQKHYWNNIFDSRYESLMRSANWPPLKVILIPRTHVDSIWKRTFERCHNDTVQKIISNVVKKLQFYNNLTFSWNEVSHLSEWWKSASMKSRSALRRLLKGGRLEITTGGYVETDEATAHIFGLVHQLIEGQQWLKNNLNYEPQVAWLTNSVAHSPTMAYLLSASGITNLVITNLHYSWEEFFAEYQYSDFIWIQNWENDNSAPSTLNTVLGRIGSDRLPRHSMLTHFLQFNSAGFRACGPNSTICANNFNFAKTKQVPDVYSHNVKEKSELLLEQYSKTGTITQHNTIIAPLGGLFHYEKQTEFDYQYNNYQQLAGYVNANRDIYKATIEFGTAKDYFDNIVKKHKSYPTLTGDFMNFADLDNGVPAYWTGYFTSRPWLKVLLRRIQSTLRSTEILFSFAVNFNALQGFDTTEIFQLLIKAREFVARLQDRHIVSGTLTSNAIKYIYKQILASVKNCWHIQEIAASVLSVKPNNTIQSPYLQKYVYREGEFISMFRIVAPGDQVYIFNSLSHERTEVIELLVRNPNIRIIDHNKKEVTFQINPVWKYNADNFIRVSKIFYKILFAIIIPPLTLELYRIKDTYDASQNAATIYCAACIVDDVPAEGSVFPFHIQDVEPGDIQLESYKHRLIFDEHTGFLKHVVEKNSGVEKIVLIEYGAFKSSNVNSGVFLFNTNVTKPLQDILMAYRIGMKAKVLLIISGQVTTELTSIYGRLLQTTVKIFNLLNSPLSQAIHVESKVDYEISPKNREIELFMSIQTNIGNGNPPVIFTDNNGFQYTARTLNISRRIESNMYPMTTMGFIQDHKSRMTVITDHAQGVTALQEGQLVVMLDRRVLFNDGRGTHEGLADSTATNHRHLILLENFVDIPSHTPLDSNLQLPSLSAVHLANSLDYRLEIFIIDRSKSNLCYYAFLPLVKTSFPCDVALINYRVNFNKGPLLYQPPNTALMILHRQSVSCNIDYDVQLHCTGDNIFSLEKILHNVNVVYKTNLCGTDKGVRITHINQANFPAMELVTLRVWF